jgi:hypothetical protein
MTNPPSSPGKLAAPKQGAARPEQATSTLGDKAGVSKMQEAMTGSRNASHIRISIRTAKKRLIDTHTIRNPRTHNKTNERSHF